MKFMAKPGIGGALPDSLCIIMGKRICAVTVMWTGIAIAAEKWVFLLAVLKIKKYRGYPGRPVY
jgi:hypothetical protein